MLQTLARIAQPAQALLRSGSSRPNTPRQRNEACISQSLFPFALFPASTIVKPFFIPALLLRWNGSHG